MNTHPATSVEVNMHSPLARRKFLQSSAIALGGQKCKPFIIDA